MFDVAENTEVEIKKNPKRKEKNLSCQIYERDVARFPRCRQQIEVMV
jgi:hypothetical protein